MTVVASTSRERVIGFGKELEHEFIRLEAKTEEHGFITVIEADKVYRQYLERKRKLYGFMSRRCGVDVFGYLAVLVVNASHCTRRTHEAVGFFECIFVYRNGH